jgi:hypothetical protein
MGRWENTWPCVLKSSKCVVPVGRCNVVPGGEGRVQVCDLQLQLCSRNVAGLGFRGTRVSLDSLVVVSAIHQCALACQRMLPICFALQLIVTTALTACSSLHRSSFVYTCCLRACVLADRIVFLQSCIEGRHTLQLCSWVAVFGQFTE